MPASFAAPQRATARSLSLSLYFSLRPDSGVERLLKIDDPPTPRRPTLVFSPVPMGEKLNGRESGFDYPESSFTRLTSHVPSFFFVLSVSFQFGSTCLFSLVPLWSVDFFLFLPDGEYSFFFFVRARARKNVVSSKSAAESFTGLSEFSAAIFCPLPPERPGRYAFNVPTAARFARKLVSQ